MIASPACAPNVVANDADARHPLADDDRATTLSSSSAAVLLGHVDAEQAELAAPLEQLAGERPVLLLEPIERRQRPRCR